MSGPVLITGAAGFAGGHLLERLAGRHDLVAWARSEPDPEFAALARWQQVDLLDRERVRVLIADVRPSAVYHLAGFSQVAKSFDAPALPYSSNVLATHHLFDAIRRIGGGSRILLTGSAAIYGSSSGPLDEDAPIAPRSPYAVSKLAQEQLGQRSLKEDGVEVILTRPFNHTGPRQTTAFMAPTIASQIAAIERGQLEPVLRVGNTSAVREVTDVRDVVRAYEALMQQGTPGTIYNVASGIGHSVQQIVDGLIARSRVPVRVEVDPSRLRASDNPVLLGNATRLMSATGWHPEIRFEQTLDDLLDYWRNREP